LEVPPVTGVASFRDPIEGPEETTSSTTLNFPTPRRYPQPSSRGPPECFEPSFK